MSYDNGDFREQFDDADYLDPSESLTRNEREYLTDRLAEAENELSELLLDVDEKREEIEYIKVRLGWE